MSEAGPLRVGIIGLGRVAWQLEQDPLRNKPCTHWGAWQSRADVQVVAGCDSDRDKHADFQAANPQARLYADYREMLADADLDLLSVCAYADSRAEMVVAAARAGVRGLWCEKAMACSLAEARAMQQAAAEAGMVCIVSFMRRWVPAYDQAARLIAVGELGRVESVNVQFSSNMLHTGTHAFDVLRLWFGEVVGVQAWLGGDAAGSDNSGYRYTPERELEDLGGFALLRFENGVRACIQAAPKDYFRFEFEVLGSRGLLRLGNRQKQWFSTGASGSYSGFSELREQPFPRLPKANMWQSACADLVGAVRDGTVPRCTLEDGRQSLAIGLAMHQSQAQGHREVSPQQVDSGLRIASR